MRRTCLILMIFLAVMKLKAQCNYLFHPMLKQPVLISGYNFRLSDVTPYQNYYVAQTKTVDSRRSSVIYSIWDGKSWRNTTPVTFESGTMELLFWNNKMLAFGSSFRVDSIKAPMGKIISFATYENGKWDTLQGGVFNQNEWTNYRAYATETGLYFIGLDNDGKKSVYIYDTTLSKFRLLMRYEQLFGYSGGIQGGRKTLLIGNVYKTDTLNNPGYVYLRGDSIFTNPGYMSYDYIYAIDGDHDKIYSVIYNLGNRYPVVLSMDKDTLTYRVTDKFNVQRLNFLVKDGFFVWQVSEKYYSMSACFLCPEENRWVESYIVSPNLYWHSSDINVSKDGFFLLNNDNNTVLYLSKATNISGTAYFDNNKNCKYEPGIDSLLANIPIVIKSNHFQQEFMTDAKGHYNLTVFPGTFTFEVIGSFSPCTSSTFVALKTDAVYLHDLCIVKPEFSDVSVSVFASFGSRLNAANTLYGFIQNKGRAQDTVNFSLKLDERLTPGAICDDQVKTIHGSIYEGYFKDLNYCSSDFFTIKYYPNMPQVSEGNRVCFDYSAFPKDADSHPADNMVRACSFGRYSLDPNYISCNEYRIAPLKSKVLEYQINFQNEGSDYADEVIIRDTLVYSDFIIDSLQIIGASHPYYAVIENNAIMIRFRNIHLEAKSIDESHSIGFVRFKVYCRKDLQPGDSISNRASIYFDLNDPICTNQNRVYLDTLNVGQIQYTAMFPFRVYPNPGKGTLYLSSSEELSGSLIRVLDINGLMVYRAVANDGFEQSLDLSDLVNGLYILEIEQHGQMYRTKLILAD